MKSELLNILFVGAGGFVGSVFRYSFAKLFLYLNLVTLPYSTFSVNIIGSLILGILMQIILNTNILNPRFALFLTVGFCGGFTTFSTFSYENILLLREGQILNFVIYTLSSLILGLAAVYLGFILSKYTITG